TETLATFFTALTICALLRAFDEAPDQPAAGSLDKKFLPRFAGRFLVAGILAGIGTLVRPETPLLLAAAGLVLCVRWRRQTDWPKLALAGLWMAAGLLLPLAPWAARNARTLGRVEFLAPPYAQTQGDF